MNNGQFTDGYDPRRNLEGRPSGSKNYTTVISNFIEATVKYKNPLIDETMDCTPPEALIMHLYYLAIVKDNTAAAKLLLDKIEAITQEQEQDKNPWDMSYEELKEEQKRHDYFHTPEELQERIEELQEIIKDKQQRGAKRE